jgi:hypothetical protein
MGMTVARGPSFQPDDGGPRGLIQGEAGRALQRELQAAIAHQSRARFQAPVVGVGGTSVVFSRSITADEAKRIARSVLERSEARRATAAKEEADKGIQYEENSD